jgi:hypothetical protein
MQTNQTSSLLAPGTLLVQICRSHRSLIAKCSFLKSAIHEVRSTQAYQSLVVKDQLIFETAVTLNSQND